MDATAESVSQTAALFKALGQQANNVLHMMVLRYVNTGDRVLDTALGMLINAFLTWFMAFVSGWTVMVMLHRAFLGAQQCCACCCRRARNASKASGAAKGQVHDPTDIDMDRFVPRPLRVYRYKVQLATASSLAMVCRWIINTHKDRVKLKQPMTVYAYKDQKGFTCSDQLQTGDRRFDDYWGRNVSCLDVLPIWLAADKQTYVVAGFVAELGDFRFYCDTIDVVRDCLQHIAQYDGQLMLEYNIGANSSEEQKEKQPEKAMSIYQHTPYLGLGEVNTKRTFDTIFFSQKPELLNILGKFRTKTLYPAHMAVDNKLGILLHGPPGTGKSACILAMANYLKRDILMVDMKMVNSRADLDTVFRPELRDERFHLDNVILVLEEIDVLLGVLCSRDSKTGGPVSVTPDVEAKEKNSIVDKLLELSLKATDKAERNRLLKEYKEAKTQASAQVDLAYFLLKLDGLEKAEGRLLLATTNHPAKLDPALLRPGRFDLKLLLGFASPDIIADMLQHIFLLTDEDREHVLRMGLPKDTWTPAEVQSIAIGQPNARAAAQKLQCRWPRSSPSGANASETA